MDEIDWVERNEFRMLDGKVDLKEAGASISLLSFPRSGNAFSKNFLQ